MASLKGSRRNDEGRPPVGSLTPTQEEQLINRVLGYAAALSWLGLATVTAAGTLTTQASLLHVNWTMAGVFATIGLFVAWRTASIERLRSRNPAIPEIERFLPIEAISVTEMLLAGILCMLAAGCRRHRGDRQAGLRRHD